MTKHMPLEMISTVMATMAMKSTAIFWSRWSSWRCQVRWHFCCTIAHGGKEDRKKNEDKQNSSNTSIKVPQARRHQYKTSNRIEACFHSQTIPTL